MSDALTLEPVVQTDEGILAKLKADIEALSDGAIMWSRSVYTARRTVHRIFKNGMEIPEGGIAILMGDVDLAELAERQLIAIKAYRQTIAGDVDLVWRVEPEARVGEGGELNLYTRLCFEPSLDNVAKGVWVERTTRGFYF